MKKLTLLTLMLLATLALNAQVAINTDGSTADPSAMLEVKSDTAGMLIPRMTKAQRNAITSPATGLLVFDTESHCFYYYNGSDWVKVGTAAASALSLNDLSDAIYDGSSLFVGDNSGGSDDGNNENTALGRNALSSNTSGENNTAVGRNAGYTNTTGTGNTALGHNSLFLNTSGNHNAAIGDSALYNNTTGNSNIAIGTGALQSNTNRSNLVAIGDSALFHNGEGATNWNESIQNTAVGSKALYSNTTGFYNTAIGYQSMYNNSEGFSNAAVGNNALHNNTTGGNNTALGCYALYFNKSKDRNTAIGYGAMHYADSSGSSPHSTENTAIGYNALHGSYTPANNTGKYNTATGSTALEYNTSGSYNAAYGLGALSSNTTGNNNTALGLDALYSNSTGYSNVAIGIEALQANTDRSNLVAIGDSALFHNGEGATFSYHATRNTAVGSKALNENTTGYNNTAIGYKSLYNNSDGRYNTAIGVTALFSNTSGSYNEAFGWNALFHNTSGRNNAAYGMYALESNTYGSYNTALGDSAGYQNNGFGNVFIGYKAGASKTGENNTLYIDNDDNTTPLIYGDFSSREIGFGTTSPGAKLEIRSATDESPLWVRINTVTKLKVHSNGSVSIGTYEEGPANGLISHGDMIPTSHKSYDLGTSTAAWDDIYYDDLHNMGAAAFTDREVTKELLNYPPKPKPAGAFDEKTEKGLKELDPNSVPPALKDGYDLLTDEMTTYNYKANYEQQVIIEKLNKKVENQKNKIKSLEKRIERLESLLENK